MNTLEELLYYCKEPEPVRSSSFDRRMGMWKNISY